MKTTPVPTFAKNSLPHPWRLLTCLLALLALAPRLWGHNLDTRATGISFADDFLHQMEQRAALNQQMVQVGDEFWVLIKTTPGPGTPTGVGGYQTYYIPPGVQVTDVAYALPTTNSPQGFIPIPMKGQSPIAIGTGPIGATTTPALIGLTLPWTWALFRCCAR